MEAVTDRVTQDETLPLLVRNRPSRHIEIEASVDSLLNMALGDPCKLQLKLNAIAVYKRSLEHVSIYSLQDR